MNRLNFLKLAFGLSLAPTIIPKALSATQIPPKRRKLKCVWTVELDKDLQAYHGDQAFRHLTDEIQKEIDQEIIRILENHR